ncbi:MAG: hypothetical protein A2096_15900 [Spirochaetes bacterium GWF1_41_5]|nr:MAG: hypothetical protein A2096_15900 [Spirochaetes bacterium GWF1_41_5]HBE03097.1 hypothetical protein [Spirochaetia bacterium]
MALKIGIIGSGFMAQAVHLPCLCRIPGVEVGLYTPEIEIARKLQNKWNIRRLFTSVSDLIAGDYDALLVLTRVEYHAWYIERALLAGKHVFTEKPLCMFSETAQKLADLAEKKKLLLMTGYMKRHENAVAAVLAHISDCRAGEILFARTHSFIGSWWDARIGDYMDIYRSENTPGPEPEKREPAAAFLSCTADDKFYSFDNPYYALLDTGCHSVNFIKYITGKNPEIVSSIQKKTRLTLLDFGSFTGSMEFCINFNMHAWDEIHEVYFQNGRLRICTQAPLNMQHAAEAEWYYEDDDRSKKICFTDNHDWSFARQMKEFIRAVRDNDITAGNAVCAADDIKCMETMQQITR